MNGSAQARLIRAGSTDQRKGWWWCDYSVNGIRRRESCQTQDRDAAIAYLRRKEGKLASGELLTPDRVRVRDLLALVLEDFYDVRGVAQAYISSEASPAYRNGRSVSDQPANDQML